MTAIRLNQLKTFTVSLFLIFSASLLGGCATTTAFLETAAESMTPTVMASLDSFETAAYSISLSNRVLLEIPLSEKDEWPNKLYGQFDGMTMFKMGAALLGSSQGVTIPTEIDPQTGFPRPTSALYIALKDRDRMLNNLNNKQIIRYFNSKPKTVITYPEFPDTTLAVPIIYRNPLMAYGVVTANNQDIMELQNEIDMTAKGYKSCNLFIHRQKEEIKDEAIKKAACPDRSITDEDTQKKLMSKIAEKKEEKEQMEKVYGKLANNVYSAAVAGADFTTAALTKIASAIVNGVRALPNIRQEFQGVRGAYNIAMIIPRVKNAFNAMGLYKDNLGFQLTVYKTMYQQIKGTYEIKDNEPTKEARKRIDTAHTILAGLDEKLNQAVAGEYVSFTRKETDQLAALSRLFPESPVLEQAFMAALAQ